MSIGAATRITLQADSRRARIAIARAARLFIKQTFTRGPQQPAPFELLFVRDRELLYIRPKGNAPHSFGSNR